VLDYIHLAAKKLREKMRTLASLIKGSSVLKLG
jgi:hypothetical protein